MPENFSNAPINVGPAKIPHGTVYNVAHSIFRPLFSQQLFEPSTKTTASTIYDKEMQHGRDGVHRGTAPSWPLHLLPGRFHLAGPHVSRYSPLRTAKVEIFHVQREPPLQHGVLPQL